MTNLRLAALAAAVILPLGAGGCSDDAAAPPAPPESSRSPSPTTSPEPTTPNPDSSEAASAAATDLVGRYYALRDLLRQDPSTPLARLDEVASGTELTAQRALFERERDRGLRQTGDTVVAEVEVQAVNLDNSDPEAGQAPTVQVDVCWDVAAVDIRDSAGTSVVSPDRPDSGWIRYAVVNDRWEADPSGGWRVSTSQDLEREPCDAS